MTVGEIILTHNIHALCSSNNFLAILSIGTQFVFNNMAGKQNAY